MEDGLRFKEEGYDGLMSIRQKITYETDDGQAFKTRKEADRKPMTVREKLESGMRLSEDELCGLAYGDECDFAIVHEAKGKNRRWSRSMRTVLKDEETGTLWCVDWEDGLTESQEDEFYDQPYKVTLEQVPVTVTKTTIKKVGE